MTANEPPFLSSVDLINALVRLDADLVAGFALARDEEARDRLRNRIRRIQARANATAIEQFAVQQRETVAVMMVLINEWASMLEALQGVEPEAAARPAL